MATPVVVSRIQNRRGTQSQFDNLYPPGYTGTGGFNPPGSGPIGYTEAAFPNVLRPGELALATDTRRMFMGNLNGEYIEVGAGGGGSLSFTPLVIVLPPAATFTAIPALEYDPTPFFTLFYDITDSLLANWNTVGTNFSRNGEMKITATVDNVAPPVRAMLADVSAEVNLSSPLDISFIADYNVASTKIEILYKHNFATSLTFATTALNWVPI